MEMGDCPERDEMLKKIMKKQPFFVRQVAPQIMSERQTERLLEHSHKTAMAFSTNSKAVQVRTALQHSPLARIKVR